MIGKTMGRGVLGLSQASRMRRAEARDRASRTLETRGPVRWRSVELLKKTPLPPQPRMKASMTALRNVHVLQILC